MKITQLFSDTQDPGFSLSIEIVTTTAVVTTTSVVTTTADNFFLLYIHSEGELGARQVVKKIGKLLDDLFPCQGLVLGSVRAGLFRVCPYT